MNDLIRCLMYLGQWHSGPLALNGCWWYKPLEIQRKDSSKIIQIFISMVNMMVLRVFKLWKDGLTLCVCMTWLCGRHFIKGIIETKKMFDFCDKNIMCIIENIPITCINMVMAHLEKSSVTTIENSRKMM